MRPSASSSIAALPISPPLLCATRATPRRSRAASAASTRRPEAGIARVLIPSSGMTCTGCPRGRECVGERSQKLPPLVDPGDEHDGAFGARSRTTRELGRGGRVRASGSRSGSRPAGTARGRAVSWCGHKVGDVPRDHHRVGVHDDVRTVHLAERRAGVALAESARPRRRHDRVTVAVDRRGSCAWLVPTRSSMRSVSMCGI